MGADEMANEGTFRPIKLVLPQGKLISADPTAPMFMYPTPFPTVIDAIIKALENGAARRACRAAISAPIRACASTAGAPTARSSTPTTPATAAGAPARPTTAPGPFRTMAHGDTRIIPLELQESLMPFRIEEFSLREDSGGAGKFRGGLGFRKNYRILRPCHLGTNLDRTKYPPWGVQGGKEARPGRFTLVEGGRDRRAERRQGERLPAAAGRPRLRRDRRRRRLRPAGRARARR